MFLFLIFLNGCSTTEIIQSKEDALINYATASAQKGNWIDSFYYLEDTLSSTKPNIKMDSLALINKYPSIISDFSAETLSSCTKGFPIERCRKLIDNRVSIYKKSATEAEYRSTLAAIERYVSLNLKPEQIVVPQSKSIVKLFNNDISFGFKYFILGSSESSIVGNSTSWRCFDNTQKLLADRSCHALNSIETIAGIVPKSIFLLFSDDQLITVSITIKSSEFKQVSLALSEKYGKGTVKSEIVTNRMGAKFSSEEVKWDVGDFRLSIKERSGTIEESSVLYSHKFAQDSFKDRVEKQSINNAKDL